MPRSIQEILDHADELAKRFEDYEPSADDEVAVAEHLLRRAALARARSERKQYHFWPGEVGLDAWDVDRLIALTAESPVEEVLLEDLVEIDSVYWFDQSERPTVRKVVEHFRLLQEVDPSYPIIIGPDNRVMDGMHRVARALVEDRATIRAVRLRELPEPDYRGCRPDELPYDR